MKSLFALILLVANLSLEDIVLDIYRGMTEIGEVDYEQLQTDLYALHENPIDLNNTSEEELSQLVFLSPQQIDDILMYADKHPFESLYELRMINSLADYEIRNLLPFVRVSASADNYKVYAREVFAHAKHEIIARVDARNTENTPTNSDPMYVQTRYRFDYKRKVIFGAQLRRPEGGQAQDLEYGAYVQLRDISPHLHSIVGGNFQASFGQGLVFAPAFRSGKSAYVASVGQTTEGLRYYSSADGAGLHGAGATLRWNWGKATRLDVSALYSMKRANDSIWQHVIGANLTLRHQRLQVELTAAQNLWSDSIHPYRDAAYNAHYYRGRHQAVVGASARYNYGWFDAFAEVAASENNERLQVTGYGLQEKARWGAGVLAGSRFYPTDGVTLIALYRYYSPWFDNALGYGFSESSRMGDENGGYLGWDINRWKGWRINGYADVFYFSGVKYGIPQAGTIGFDVMAEAGWGKEVTGYGLRVTGRLRARKKGPSYTYSARGAFDWTSGPWSLRTTIDANLSGQPSVVSSQPYGVSVAQDVEYNFQSPMSNLRCPLSLKGRVQFFDARDWDNRIYLYEHDVLYAFSIPATYGFGGRAYICLRWQIIQQLSLYLRLSETLYERTWASAHNRAQTRTDIHLLLRAKF